MFSRHNFPPVLFVVPANCYRKKMLPSFASFVVFHVLLKEFNFNNLYVKCSNVGSLKHMSVLKGSRRTEYLPGKTASWESQSK